MSHSAPSRGDVSSVGLLTLATCLLAAGATLSLSSCQDPGPGPSHGTATVPPATSAPADEGENYRIVFSTYLGGSNWEHARDVVTDPQGNIYVAGGSASSPQEGFPVTPGSYQTTFVTGGEQAGAHKPAPDAFAASLTPEGRLRWATYLGGPNYDRAYSIERAPDGGVVLTGRAGPGFPTTRGVFQPQWMGNIHTPRNDLYGCENAFVCKLSPDGNRLLWSTHVGIGHLCRGSVVDDAGDIYVAMAKVTGEDLPEPNWFPAAFANAFQKKPAGGVNDLAIVKIKGDGSKVLWATWLCGSGEERESACVRVDAQHNVYVGMCTNSPDLPVTEGGGRYKGDFDGYYAKLSPDGSRLLYGTYVGGSKFDQGNETQNLFVDAQGNAYATILTNSPDFPVTKDRGVYENGRRGKGLNIAAIKLSPEGKLLLSCIVGDSGADKCEGMTVDGSGCVLIAGRTNADDYPTTARALQRRRVGTKDNAVLTKLSPDFRRLLYSTYIGGEGDQFLRAVHVDVKGNIYAVGSAVGGWPTVKAFQEKFAGTTDPRWANGDVIVLKLEPTP